MHNMYCVTKPLIDYQSAARILDGPDVTLIMAAQGPLGPKPPELGAQFALTLPLTLLSSSSPFLVVWSQPLDCAALDFGALFLSVNLQHISHLDSENACRVKANNWETRYGSMLAAGRLSWQKRQSLTLRFSAHETSRTDGYGKLWPRNIRNLARPHQWS